jgi:hypothetical protein
MNTSRLRNGVYVHIIESPSPRDLLAGRTEGSALRGVLEICGIKHA